ncbi:MAG: prepilin-type N-terminal cleavage/methylation domain-containing protein [Planctomycetota bacterium]
MKRRKGFTLIELLVVVAIIALLISILLPSLSRARELAKRAVCAANLRGIGQGEHIYSNDNEEWFPHSFYMEPVGSTSLPNVHSVTFIGELSLNMTIRKTLSTWQNVHPSRSMFLLVIGGMTTPKQFVCPSSGDSEDPLRNKTGPTTEVAAQAGINRFDFRGYQNLSYGYQMPFGQRGKPREGMDPRMPINSDKGPYFEAGATNMTTGSTPDVARTSAPAPSFDVPTDSDLLKIPNDRWRPYNSRNHNGEGQNILFVDGHVEFLKKPCVGVNSDNIFTMAGPGYTFRETVEGRKPANLLGPFTNTDTVIIP